MREKERKRQVRESEGEKESQGSTEGAKKRGREMWGGESEINYCPPIKVIEVFKWLLP